MKPAGGLRGLPEQVALKLQMELAMEDELGWAFQTVGSGRVGRAG